MVCFNEQEGLLLAEFAIIRVEIICVKALVEPHRERADGRLLFHRADMPLAEVTATVAGSS